MNPAVTVLMPVYNGEKYLKDTIESVLSQTFLDYEFLIIDDCSTDHSERIIEEYNDTKIRFFRNEKNLGQTKTLNKGIKLARGNFIARCDQDDINYPTRLSMQYEYLISNPKVALLGTAVNFINQEGKNLYFNPIVRHHNKILEKFCMGNPIMHSSVMFNRKIIMNLNGYSTDFMICQDADLWLKIARENIIDNLAERLVSIRIHNDQVTRNNHYDKLRFSEAEKIYYQLTKFPNLSYSSITLAKAVRLYYLNKIGNKTLPISLFFIFYNYPSLILNKYFWMKILLTLKSKFILKVI